MARLLAVLAVLLAAPPAAHAASPAAGGLRLLHEQRLDARLRELTFRTSALPGPVKARVLLPDGYARATRKRYPVLLLLHGASGNERSWTEAGDAEALTRGRDLIVVMPDGGVNGFYTDWYNGGRGGAPRWETFHIRQLLPWVDSHYRTLARRSERAIAGLSMGGFGAMSYAARHPDVFGAAASFSGAVDIDGPIGPVTVGFVTGGAGDAVFGPRATERIRWQEHDPGSLARNLRTLQLTLRTGDGKPGGPFGGGPDALETGVHVANVDLHGSLRDLRIAHLWDDYGPGTHTWPYWIRGLRQTLPRFQAVFDRDAPVPARFEHVAVEPRYSVFGWHVAVHRRALEFSRLARTGPRSFSLAGSGTATVTTPRVARARQRVTARVVRTGAVRTLRLRADRRGRVRLDVRLGAPNAAQALRAAGRTRVFTTRVALRPAR